MLVPKLQMLYWPGKIRNTSPAWKGRQETIFYRINLESEDTRKKEKVIKYVQRLQWYKTLLNGEACQQNNEEEITCDCPEEEKSLFVCNKTELFLSFLFDKYELFLSYDYCYNIFFH